MKLKVLLSFLLLTSFLQAQIVSIPNANFKAKLLAAGPSNYTAKNLSNAYFKIDANNDGEIQTSEALQVGYLDVAYSNITSLEGIQSFTNLVSLNFEMNYVASINLTSLTHLYELKSGGNQFTTLNLNGLTNLYTLTCSGNDLTSLNVSGLTNLHYLDCSENALTSLNMFNLDNIEYINCDGNQLTNLDVAYMPSLQNLYCRRNQISYIYLSGNTALQDFRCSNNNLFNINLSGMDNLRYLDCEFNQLTSLDVSGKTFLRTIMCNHNLLWTLDISDCTFLDTLYCMFNPNMQSLYLKNESNELVEIIGNTSLSFICCDASQLAAIQNRVSSAGLACVVSTDCSLAVDDFNTSKLNVYPNPVKDDLYFKTDFNIDTIEVFDVNGKMLLHVAVSGNKTNLSQLQTGNYLLKAYSGNKALTAKIIKE